MAAYDTFNDKKIIVTGGAGFIGSHICEELVNHKAIVYCIDNFSAGKESNIKHLTNYDNFVLVRKDVCDSDKEMDEIFTGVECVFHNAASKKNVCLIDPQKDLRVNGGGTLNLLEYSIKHKIKKFVHASTGSVYGEPKIFPSDEDHPLAPVSYYGVSKLAGERYVSVFNKLYGLDTTILRYFHVYGPRQESNEFGGVVSIFLRNIVENKSPIVFGSGDQVRSFTWVKDLVQANLMAAISPIASGKVYNAASGIRVTVNDLALNMLKILGKDSKLPVKYGDPLIGDIMNFDVSNKKITSDLGISFNQDFWGTLKVAIGNADAFLGR